MPKILNVRERVHQPFRDTLCRFSGWVGGNVQDNTDLFNGGSQKNDAETNFRGGGSALPSDQSFVALVLRVMLMFKNPQQRGPTIVVAGGINYPQANGDFQFNAAGSTYDVAQAAAANGQAPGSIEDVHRLYFQASEQALWSFGAGLKNSIDSMPSSYFPYGGGLHGDLAGATDLIHWTNGMPGHDAILRLGRAIVIPARQNVRAKVQLVSLSAGTQGANSALFNTAQGTRDMLSLRDNLNAVDGINKILSLTFDGLQSREVQ
jgi:hypothetical protein